MLKKNDVTKKQKEKFVRHEFRLSWELSEKLREFIFYNRTNKTKVVTEALEKFLKQ